MAVVIKGVEKGSFAEKAGIKPNEILCELNGNEIVDVLDYRFYQNETVLSVKVQSTDGTVRSVTVKKPEYDELGLEFETYLMDKQHSCKNKCIFCFIDQLPKGMRESLYFKDDDSRMSFLFGNYITLTNLTEHEIERIIKLHISPVNVSVHTTDPDLRVKMMGN
ncbi:MAG: radical SAM protein, partial [Clostridia bacterium]|nr:radical SAM protein [Clostridia bacterium]